MRVQKLFTVLADLSSPLPEIPADELFSIWDGNKPPYSRMRNRLRRTQRKCHFCGKECSIHGDLDHRIPISRGGLSTETNLVLTCRKCNSHKSKLTEREYVRTIMETLHRVRLRLRQERLTVSAGTLPKRQRELAPT